VSNPEPLGLFQGFGIELEWMVVDERTLSVEPIVDRVLTDLAGSLQMEVELGAVAWSNELARHVIEIKTNGPSADLSTAARELYAGVAGLAPVLRAHGVRLMPTAMHPWMVPDREFVLWPRDDEGIYGTFDRIFDCRGHGWSNLQSMHINLPFASDAEFSRLHDAIRLLLPILPALAASSPLKEGQWCPNLDERLVTYRGNAAKVPSVAGMVVPERVHGREQYEREILDRIYRDLEPHDPEGLLRYEWVNARGAIARFDRNAIEIRVLDVQECVRANLAIAHGVVEVLRDAVERPSFAFDGGERPLLSILELVAKEGDRAIIEEREYLGALGVETTRATASDLWGELLARVPAARRDATLWSTLTEVVERGCLARRIRESLGGSTARPDLERVYRRLCDCLDRDEVFAP
jgi:glutamate---cysteine ligase / carboxylate-amine ligase